MKICPNCDCEVKIEDIDNRGLCPKCQYYIGVEDDYPEELNFD